ncbi:helix-turn-helix domain-containing protein [Trichloromonas acetexigens]|uniref:Helix-turn-helix domain-containing protein n=1 Tax=Trichloromonas acetexigens TaxID=38815 RepID=A0A550J317_9BACT|nr:helix-turn-helix domain-containing protein [Desulfuromonas acetexigens]TRO77533.1 helix-turn-helix domain-containing protein [Desulfuromonas acetexigens]
MGKEEPERFQADDATGKQLLTAILDRVGLPVRPCYCRGDVMRILGVKRQTFSRMVNYYDEYPDGRIAKPWMLDSFRIFSHCRVTFDDLTAWLERNREKALERIHKNDD